MSLSETRIEILPDGLAQIVESVFETMMNLEASSCGEPWFPSGDRVTAAVRLSGDWSGCVIVECNRGQVCRLASRFLSMQPHEVLDEVAYDVLGELANMIGGNLKSMLAPHILISMPLVLEGSSPALPAGLRMAFSSAEGIVWVTVTS